MKRGNVKPPTLDSLYDSAVLGCTISPLSKPRIVYSLPRLATIVRFAEAVELDEAHGIVMSMITGSMSKFGASAPVFVDDTFDIEQENHVETPASDPN